MPFALIQAAENTYILGRPWPVAALVVAAILLVIDTFFFAGDVLTYVAHVIVTAVILHFLPTSNVIWLTAAGIAIYATIMAVHLLGWKQLAERFLNKIVAPDKHLALNDTLVGKQGTLRKIDNQWFIHVDEEWLGCTLNTQRQNDIKDGTTAVVDSVNEHGNLTVTPSTNPPTNN